MMQKQYDIIILGAGVAGLSLASLLADLHLSILVIDRQVAPQPCQGVDLMQRAFNQRSRHIMQEIGIWDELTVGQYSAMFVWDDNACITFKASDVGQNTLGHIVSYQAVQYALYQRLTNNKNIHFLFEASPSRFSMLAKQSLLQVNDQSFSASLVVGADGKKSWLRSALGVDCEVHSYGESALVANVKTTLTHQQTAWQRFLPTGPLAFLPLSDPHRCSIVWTNETSKTQELLAQKECDFLTALNKAFEGKLSEIVEVSNRAAFSLDRQHAKQYVGQSWALIADAAHVVHPLAGLGLNLGLGDVQCLSACIKQAVLNKQSIGDLTVLRAYERVQRSRNKKLLFGMHQLHELFLSQHALVEWLRDAGLNGSNRSRVAKRFFINQVA